MSERRLVGSDDDLAARSIDCEHVARGNRIRSVVQSDHCRNVAVARDDADMAGRTALLRNETAHAGEVYHRHIGRRKRVGDDYIALLHAVERIAHAARKIGGNTREYVADIGFAGAQILVVDSGEHRRRLLARRSNCRKG